MAMEGILRSMALLSQCDRVVNIWSVAASSFLGEAEFDEDFLVVEAFPVRKGLPGARAAGNCFGGEFFVFEFRLREGLQEPFRCCVNTSNSCATAWSRAGRGDRGVGELFVGS